VAVIEKTLQAHGYNLGMNLGRAAGSGVEEHLHMHALPRWNGDTNFMHIVAATSTVPASLEVLWAQMRPLFTALDDAVRHPSSIVDGTASSLNGRGL
jgi:ATP adenylyltransferase